MPTTILRTCNGKLDAADRASFESLSHRLAQGNGTVLLHLHGGLVSQAAGEAAARRLSGGGPQAYNAPGDFEEIYVVWRTGLLETMKTNWRDLFENDRLYKTLFKRLLQYVASRVDLADGSGRSIGSTIVLTDAEVSARLSSGIDAPFADLDESAGSEASERSLQPSAYDRETVEAEIGAILEFDPDLVDVSASIASRQGGGSIGRAGTDPGDPLEGQSILKRLDEQVAAELENEAAAASGRGVLTTAMILKALVKHAANIGWRVLKRYRSGRDHGIHATVVEEILRELYADLVGATIWGMMKKDAADHFAAQAFGSELINVLASSGARIIVVGHSAGAIWTSEFLKAARARAGFQKVDVVLLAPAVRTSEFAGMLEQASNLISQFRIFTMEDRYEKGDPVLGSGLGMIYPSSLLYVISGVLEEREGDAYVDAPILGMHRFLSRHPDWIAEELERDALLATRAYLDGVQHSVVYSVAAGSPGLSSSARSHGGFDEDSDTLRSIGSMFWP